MGAHYTSIQVKGEGRDTVRQVAEVVAREQKRKVLLGPELNGWVGLYPDDLGSDDELAEALAKKLKGVVLYLMVFHSDLFTFRFFRGSELLDQYSSDPDCFEEVSAAEHKRLRGKPEVFRDLVGTDEKVAKLAVILHSKDKEKYLIEEDRMEQFGGLLGIENTLASYEYLTNGEWDNIKGRKQFVHIPDQAPEKEARRAAKTALRAQKKALQKQGLLCLECNSPSKWRGDGRGTFCFDPVHGGMLLEWHPLGGVGRQPTEVMRYRSPWQEHPELLGPVVCGSFTYIVNPTGALVAFSDGQLRIWNLHEQRFAATISTDAVPLTFSVDSRLLVCQAARQLVLVSLEELRVVRTLTVSGSIRAVHPSCEFMVTRPRQDLLGIYELRTGKLEKTLFMGQVRDWSTLAPLVEGTFRRAGVKEAELAEWRQAFVMGSTLLKLTFSPDGKLVFCCTDSGLAVLKWEALLASSRATPRPLFSVLPVPEAWGVEHRSGENSVYDLAFDRVRNWLLFGGAEGVIRFLDLSDGRTGVLLDPPGKSPIVNLELSHDRQFIGCMCCPRFEEASREPWRIQVWSYSECGMRNESD